MNFNIDKLDNFQLDVLKEIANIGAGNAATALSIMLNKPINMDVPKINIIYFNEVENILGGADKKVTGIYLEFYSDIAGTVMFVLDELSTENLLSFFFTGNGKEKNFNELDEMKFSALKEIGNILTGSFLTALSKITGLDIKYTIPSVTVDMAGAILSVPLIEFGQQGDRALFVETKFTEGMEQVNGYLFLIPNMDSYNIILRSLGVV